MSVYERVQQALTEAKTKGGKNGLNCIAELDMTAIEQAKELDACSKEEVSDFWGTPVLVKDNLKIN